MSWIDISIPLRNGMPHWPDDTPIRLRRVLEAERGQRFTLTIATMTLHTGTHIDAPAHFIASGATIDMMPPDAMAGEARVIAIEDPLRIGPEELERAAIRKGERILFKTRNSDRCWRTDEFVSDAVELTQEAARYLAARRPRCIGIDYMSVGDDDVHRILLGAGIWCIEWLNLGAVGPGHYELLCLPLAITGAEAAPARAMLRPLASPGQQ